MRLTTIKLSGFKSFVDPTTLHLPTNMTGVVGPNGCGKSNIIDAIRWVMGESAASRLRGDSITDVIFSGSSTRKPVGSATVELIFDNSDGTITGEYASFNEISVKRMVSRDGASAYYLNGGRCRRRDIVDVFLGTGLGARSYSIIEQGMISQIVEARPEDLRVHLEEAAGISKYKERRKETEARIKGTRENLTRLNDVREEVDKQIEHLRRQARAAERYQQLKEEHKRVEAELKALNLQALQGDLAQKHQAIKDSELSLEALIAEQRQLEAQIEAGREANIGASEAFNAVQAQVYRIGGDVARAEQQIQHNRDLSERLQRQLKEAQTALAEVDEHIRVDREQIDTLSTAVTDAAPQLETINELKATRDEALATAEAQLAEWQAAWDQYSQQSGEASRLAEVERTRIDYLDRQTLEISKRIEVLEQERKQADETALTSALSNITEQYTEQREKVDSLTQILETRRDELEKQLEQQRLLQATLADTRKQTEAQRGRLSSLEALQHAALGQDGGVLAEWLRAAGLQNAKRLGEVLDVQSGWEQAVETVLAGLMDGVLCDDVLQHTDALASAEKSNVFLLSASDSQANYQGTLAAVCKGPAAISHILSKVRCADSLQQATQIAATLSSDQSVITQSGEWLAKDWARVVRADGGQMGVLSREKEIQSLAAQLQTNEARIEEIAEQLDAVKSAIVEAEQHRDDAQRESYMTHRRVSELSGQIQSQKGRVEAAQQRVIKIAEESSQLKAKETELQGQAKAARGVLETEVSRMGTQEQLRVNLDGQRRQLLERREGARFDAQEVRDQAHQLALQVESKRSAVRSLEQALQRLDSQRAHFASSVEEITAQLAQGGTPMQELEAELRTYLDQRLLVDKQLAAARKVLDDCEAEIRKFDQARHRIDQNLTAAREVLSGKRMEEQGIALRAQQLSDAIAVAGFDLESISAEIAEGANPTDWQARAEELENKFRRLEPVNLAAIQEFQEQSTRKSYLDAQYDDLTQALDTLEGAIRKIDKETRTRFKETFDRVNVGLQELFPRLFGGGHAFLELTGEDMLDTGVSIMARPPGKRVTSISLLSGGEKALTAVALVFAIFRLNPAPFCLLDEVDAPLDEANVGRFCSLVKEMSEQVQFLFVSHNKATMEAANQLCGVTMREPGVSRLVLVDLEEAAKLVGAA